MQENLENLVPQDAPDPQVIKETPSVFLVQLETRGLLETSGPQDLLDLEEILECQVSSGCQDRGGAKEIQVFRVTLVNKVWWVHLVPEVARVLQASLVKPGPMVLQVQQAAKDSQVLLDHWDFMDWMD